MLADSLDIEEAEVRMNTKCRGVCRDFIVLSHKINKSGVFCCFVIIVA